MKDHAINDHAIMLVTLVLIGVTLAAAAAILKSREQSSIRPPIKPKVVPLHLH